MSTASRLSTATVAARIPYAHAAPFYALWADAPFAVRNLAPRDLGREAEAGSVDLGLMASGDFLRLRDRHGYTGFRAANLVYGIYDLSMTPSHRAFGDERLILRTKDIVKFCEAFLPHDQDRHAPPMYLRCLPTSKGCPRPSSP